MRDAQTKRLNQAIARLDSAGRALIDLSVHHGIDDERLGRFLGMEPMQVAKNRAKVLNVLADDLGMTGSARGTDLYVQLLELGDEDWQRLLPVVDEPAYEPEPVRNASPIRPNRDARARLPARRRAITPLEGFMTLVAVGIGVVLAYLSTLDTGPVVLVALAALIVTVIVFERPEIGALTLLMLVAIFPRSALFENGIGIAGGQLKISDLLVALTLGAWALQAATGRGGTRMPSRPLTLSLLALLTIALVSVLTARANGTPLKLSLLELRPLLTLMLIFPLISRVRDIRHLKLGVAAVLVVSTIASLHTISQYVLGEGDSASFTGGGVRILNTAFQYPMVATICALVFLGYVQDQRLRKLLLGIATINLAAVFFTQQRGAWVALLLALIAVFVTVPPASRRRMAYAVTGLIAASALVLVVVNASSATRSQNIFEAGLQRFLSTGQYTRDVSAGHRLAEWRRATSEVRDHPVSGIGLGSSITFWSPMYSQTNKRFGGSSSEIYIHNSYVWFALKMGLVGLTALFAVLAATFVAGFRGYRRARDEDERMLLAMGLASLVAIMILSVFGPHLNIDSATPLLAATIALIELVPRLSEQEAPVRASRATTAPGAWGGMEPHAA